MSLTPNPATWPAAVSERSEAVLLAPTRTATVLAAFPQALYLRLPHDGPACDRLPDDRFPEGRVLPVVSTRGLRLPTALVLGEATTTVGWGVQPGDKVSVGQGEVRLPGATIRAARVWRPLQVPPTARTCDPHAAPGLVELASRGWVAPARSLAAAALDGQDLTPQVSVTVGAGPGLTPSGDDVLCGLLLALRMAGALDAGARLWAAIRPRLGATTSLSAGLLAEAADGYAVPAVVRLVSTLAGGSGSPDEVRRAVRAVADIGHTSGSDLLAGVVGALATVSQADRGRTLRTIVPQRLPQARSGAAL